MKMQVLTYHQGIYQPIHIPEELNSRIYFLLYQSTAALSIYNPPWLNDRTLYWSYTDTNPVGIKSRVVLGLSKPPDQYEFAFIPRNAEILGLADPILTPSSSSPDTHYHRLRFLYHIFTPSLSVPKISCSFSLVKGMAALLQSLYASFTLIRTNDGQLNWYGLAAPGLTVLPYAVMSTLNLMANLVAPHYPTMYLVRSEVMEEAERRTGLMFHYAVGKVVEESGSNDIAMEGWTEVAGTFKDDDKLLYVSGSVEEDEKIEIRDGSDQRIYVPACPRFRRTDDSQTSNSPLRQVMNSQRPVDLHEEDSSDGLPGMIIFLAQLFIILGLSHFSGRQSTVAQRAWTVTWLIAGSFGENISDMWKSAPFAVLAGIVIYGAPAIGGFIVVFQMLRVYGICYRFV
jgi:hypothetical protein